MNTSYVAYKGEFYYSVDALVHGLKPIEPKASKRLITYYRSQCLIPDRVRFKGSKKSYYHRNALYAVSSIKMLSKFTDLTLSEIASCCKKFGYDVNALTKDLNKLDGLEDMFSHKTLGRLASLSAMLRKNIGSKKKGEGHAIIKFYDKMAKSRKFREGEKTAIKKVKQAIADSKKTDEPIFLEGKY